MQFMNDCGYNSVVQQRKDVMKKIAKWRQQVAEDTKSGVEVDASASQPHSMLCATFFRKSKFDLVWDMHRSRTLTACLRMKEVRARACCSKC